MSVAENPTDWRESIAQGRAGGRTIIAEAVKQRIAGAYPEIEPEKIVEDARERFLARKAAEEAAYKAARPYGSFEETLSLFERIGLALVKHPDIQPVHERKIRNLCHQIIETGFGLSERRKRG